MFTSPPIRLALLQKWVKRAAKIALSQFHLPQFQMKADASIVTEIDRRVESNLLSNITRCYPEHSILAEEGSIRVGNDFLWIIDPIDGTRAFATGLPIWGISLGVFHGKQPYAGVFYLPATRQMYWGTQSEAYHNQMPMGPPSHIDLQSPLAFIAVPSNAHQHYDIDFPRLRSLGSTAAHLAYVAHGIAAAALTRRIRLWDLAALLPILNATHISIMYQDGRIFDPADLLSGELSRAPLVAAHTNIIWDVLKLIQPKSNVQNK